MKKYLASQIALFSIVSHNVIGVPPVGPGLTWGNCAGLRFV